MCELLAMSSRFPARLTQSLTALASHAQGSSRNRDGWGIAYYKGGTVVLHRGIDPADTSERVRCLETDGPATSLSIAYIRHATKGPIGLQNTGPYVRVLAGRQHVFVHNGNLVDLDASDDFPDASDSNIEFTPLGDTDSELAFCLLLHRIKSLSRGTTSPVPLNKRLACVTEFATSLRKLGPSSFLYSDGEALFAHADRRLQPLTGKVTAPALYRLSCAAADSPALLLDCQLPAKTKEATLTLLASVPLSDEAWVPMSRGEVIAVQCGEISAISHIQSTEGA